MQLDRRGTQDGCEQEDESPVPPSHRGDDGSGQDDTGGDRRWQIATGATR